jgi:hypothetical protein
MGENIQRKQSKAYKILVGNTITIASSLASVTP